jgi:hypothetical protein
MQYLGQLKTIFVSIINTKIIGKKFNLNLLLQRLSQRRKILPSLSISPSFTSSFASSFLSFLLPFLHPSCKCFFSLCCEQSSILSPEEIPVKKTEPLLF